MKNKRGQLGGLQGIILTVVIVGLLVGLAFVILYALQTNLTTTTNTVTGESWNLTAAYAGRALAYNSSTLGVLCYDSATITSVVNYSGATTITAANYTLNPYTGLFRNTSSGGTYLAWNVSYTYKTGDEACQGVKDTITATKTIPTFLPIIVILAVVGILLAIVFSVLPRAGVGRGQSAEI